MTCSIVTTSDSEKDKGRQTKDQPFHIAEASGILQNRQVTWTEAVVCRLLYKFQMAMGK